MAERNLRPHGGVRGADTPLGSALFQGTFGRMFRTLPAAEFADKDLERFAAAMMAEAEEQPTPETETDDEENQGIDAGYTYLGQFLDHDITFDPMSSLQKRDDPNAITDFRTPRFDLDSVYGRGPDDQPYLYEDDGLHMKLGRKLTGSTLDPNVRDLPRHKSDKGQRARALIGDPRNDENVIVSQLQAVMLRFHNRMIDHLKGTGGADPAFADVQRAVRWHYQWVILHDFLPTIVGPAMLHRVLPHLKNNTSIYDDAPDLRFYAWANEPFMPIEFTAAVYRFGHSMVRPIYRLNTTLIGNGPERDPVNGRQLLFTPNDSTAGLNGFREFPSTWAIDWRLYFDMGVKNQPVSGVERVQKAYKIDTSLVNPLATLPLSVAKDIRSLAERNLKRGARMGLPSGQDVARLMDVQPIPDDKLRVGKATEETTKSNPLLTSISKAFSDNAPLWYYVLAEAQQEFKKNETPIRLGPIGGRIVTEVFAGLLLGDTHSFLSQYPRWQPEKAFMNEHGRFGIAELIKEAIKAT